MNGPSHLPHGSEVAPTHGAPTPMEARAIVEEIGNLPPLPEVSWKVLQITSDLNWGACDIERVVSRDQGLTAQILRLSNSAFFGVRGRVKTISLATVVVGSRRLRTLAVAASMQGVFSRRTPFGRKLWEHSLAVALASGKLAYDCGYSNREEAFVAGLLHDIGKAVLERNRPQDYDPVLELVEEGKTTLEAERQVFGFDHTELGSLVATKWNLAPETHEVIRLHHTSQEATIDPKLTALVALADQLCRKLGFSPLPPNIDDLDSEALDILKFEEDAVAGIESELGACLEADKGMLGL